MIGEIVHDLEVQNICLVIENHDRFLSREFVEILQKSGSKNIAICLDTVNSMGAGEGLETVIGLLAPYTMNLHVKEFSIRRVSHKMGFVIEGVPLGKGMLPLMELISKVSSNCQSAILGVEKAENSGDDNFKTVQLVWAAYESSATGKLI